MLLTGHENRRCGQKESEGHSASCGLQREGSTTGGSSHRPRFAKRREGMTLLIIIDDPTPIPIPCVKRTSWLSGMILVARISNRGSRHFKGITWGRDEHLLVSSLCWSRFAYPPFHVPIKYQLVYPPPISLSTISTRVTTNGSIPRYPICLSIHPWIPLSVWLSIFSTYKHVVSRN